MGEPPVPVTAQVASPGDPPDGPPLRRPLKPRALEILAAARGLLEEVSPDHLSLRLIADELGIKPPSLYKHFPDKAAIEAALIEVALAEIGTALRDAVATGPPEGALGRLLCTYRRMALDHPGLYRLATTGRLPRHRLAPGLEEWAGEPFYTVTGDPGRAQALWGFAHGMAVLELDRRFPPGSDLDRTWSVAAAAFATARPQAGHR